jgi:hypothetical protein
MSCGGAAAGCSISLLGSPYKEARVPGRWAVTRTRRARNPAGARSVKSLYVRISEKPVSVRRYRSSEKDTIAMRCVFVAALVAPC